MTAPIRVGEDPLDALKAMKAQQQSSEPDPLDELKAMRSTAPTRPAVPSAKADASGALPFNRPNPTGDYQASSNLKGQAEHVGPAILGNLANVAQGIPGMEAVEAGARSVVRRQPYREALSDIRGQTDAIPQGIKTVERMAGAAPLALLPGSPAMVGAGIGAADRVLQADPDVGLEQRAKQGAVGAAVGGTLGKVGELAATKFRAMSTPDRASNLIQREADQSAAASPLYDRSLAEGQGLTQNDPVIKNLGRLPTIQRTAAGIRANDELGTIPPGRSPEFLDRIYKGLTDEETSLEGRLMNLEKGDKSANELRQSLDNIRGIKNEVLTAYQGPMPTYPKAVGTFAEHQRGIEAVKRGYQTQTNAVAPAGGGVNQTELTSPGLSRWAGDPATTQAEREGASQGILGKLKEQPTVVHAGRIPVPVFASKALRTAPTLLRSVNAPSQQFADLLTKLGLSTANSPFASP